MGDASVGVEVSEGVAPGRTRPSAHEPPERVHGATAHDAATHLDEDPAVRCVVLSGANGTFCSGGDVGEFNMARDQLPLMLKELTTYLPAAISRFARMR